VKAGSPFGVAVEQLQEAGLSTDSQRCVCFTETPLEHVSLLTAELDDRRRCKFEPYGIAITRKQGRERGVNPVWYLDMAPGHGWLTEHWKQLVGWAIDVEVHTGEPFDDHPISKLAPFTDWMGVWPTTGRKKEFWWEREWRRCGDFRLPDTAYIVICPTEDREEIEGVVARGRIPTSLPPLVTWIPHGAWR
jgi:hypothetical protein